MFLEGWTKLAETVVDGFLNSCASWDFAYSTETSRRSHCLRLKTTTFKCSYDLALSSWASPECSDTEIGPWTIWNRFVITVTRSRYRDMLSRSPSQYSSTHHRHQSIGYLKKGPWPSFQSLNIFWMIVSHHNNSFGILLLQFASNFLLHRGSFQFQCSSWSYHPTGTFNISKMIYVWHSRMHIHLIQILLAYHYHQFTSYSLGILNLLNHMTNVIEEIFSIYDGKIPSEKLHQIKDATRTLAGFSSTQNLII